MEKSPYQPPTYKEPPQPEYQPRSLWSKLMPATFMVSAVGIFILCHFIASGNKQLLSGQFLFTSPLFLGAWIAYFSKLSRPTSQKKVLANIFWVMCAIIILSIPVLKEGIICVVMASPILYVSMSFGGLLMGWFCDKVWKSKALHSLAILPLLVLFAPIEEQKQTYQSEQSIVINATPQQIWQSINHIEDISADDFYQQSWLLPFMGVPTPKSAVTVLEGNNTDNNTYNKTNNKSVRKCQWYGDIYFDEPIIQQIPNQRLRWRFVFYPDSVPKGTLDDHVTINGKHFKLLNGQYDITAIDEKQSKLTFKVDYAITTNINFYAGMWGQWVMSEFTEDVLGLYKRRLESIKTNRKQL